MPHFFNIRKIMKKIMYILPIALMIGCGDKDEDTGSDTAAIEDTADTASE